MCLVIFQLEKQKRLERIRQKRSQLEELILQVCSTPVCVCLCVCSLTTGLQQDSQTALHMGIICRNLAILVVEDLTFRLSIHFSILRKHQPIQVHTVYTVSFLVGNEESNGFLFSDYVKKHLCCYTIETIDLWVFFDWFITKNWLIRPMRYKISGGQILELKSGVYNAVVLKCDITSKMIEECRCTTISSRF